MDWKPTPIVGMHWPLRPARTRQPIQARQDIPTPQQHAQAQQRIHQLAQANAASGGRYHVPLANAVNDKNELDQRTVTQYGSYYENTDAATGGEDPGTADGGAGIADPADPKHLRRSQRITAARGRRSQR